MKADELSREQRLYYEGEWREGFYVESKMRCAWAAEIEVLLEIDRICKKHGITWFADGGTLLGAVRHQGFIPWDDDIDIMMRRKDYQRFLQIAEKELPPSWILKHANDDKSQWEQPFARVTNGDSYSMKFERLKQFHGCPYVVGVDIFPIDNIPTDPGEEEMLYLMLQMVFGVMCLIEAGGSKEKIESNLQEIEAICKVSIDRNKKIQNQLFRVIDRLCSLYQDLETEELGYLVWELDKKEKRKWKKTCFDEIIEMPFEDIVVPVPGGYKEILTAHYGKDYMIPVQIQGDHEYPFYKKQDEELEQMRRQGEGDSCGNIQ